MISRGRAGLIALGLAVLVIAGVLIKYREYYPYYPYPAYPVYAPPPPVVACSSIARMSII